MAKYTYSRWDGSQQVFEPDEDALLESMSEDILAHGDVNRALRDLLQRGTRNEQGERVGGLRDLMERLRQQRQRQLERYNLDSLMDDLKERLRDVLDTERKGIERRLAEARRQLEEAGDDDLQGPMRLLQERAERSKQQLDALPESPGGAVKELSDYEFMDPEAQQKFQEILDMLQRQMLQNMFQSMKQQLQGMTPEDMEGAKEMIRALNQMIRDRAMGEDPDFEGFMEQYGHFFDPDRPASLDELIERISQQMIAMQSLMESMSPQMRAELESLMEPVIDSELMAEMAELAQSIYQTMPVDDLAQEYPFMGDESLTLEQAMELMGRLQDMDELERAMERVTRRGGIDDIDPAKVEEQLGEDARRQLERLQEIVRRLKDAGYLKQEGDRLDLTPRGIRKLAQQALKEVFSALQKDRAGRHEVFRRGDGGEHTGETKLYEFGDPFDIDLNRSLFNSVLREGPGVPIRMSPADMEVHRTEHLTQAATVLLLDQSRSMGMFGAFLAAKKVALALYWLTHSQYPRDYFYVIGFSDYAIEINGEDLAEATWNDWGPGTNMHHAFMLSRKLLSKVKVGSKQILMITDGEPTAHLQDGYAYFNYPPSYHTLDETLKEVKRCTQAGITINTFMLETDPYLTRFIEQLTKINRGRAFYSTPGRLGQYVMVDYLRSRRKQV
jgi:uncharacterized protein with von Willebrand factor type A (vWA) domain